MDSRNSSKTNLATNVMKYALCMFLILLSGSPALQNFGLEALLIALFGLCVLLATASKLYIQQSSVLLIVVFAALCGTHYLTFGSLIAAASVGFLLQMVIALLITALFADFVRVYVHCLFALALMSLPFYFFVALPQKEFIFAAFDIGNQPKKINIGLHTFYTVGSAQNRNAGAFWEPGAFAGYLALALFFCLIIKDKTRIYFFQVLVIVVALLTTLSTMGYIALFVVTSTYLYKVTRKLRGLKANFVLLFAVAILLIGASVAFQTLPFLAEKITEQAEDVESGEERSEVNRFGNAIYDFGFIQQRPLAGWSANIETRGIDDLQASSITRGQGNALTGFAVRFGIVGWLFCFAYMFRGFFVLSRSVVIGLAGVALMFVLLSSEKYLNFPLIMTIFFFSKNNRNLGVSRASRRRRKRRKSSINSSPAVV